MRVSRSKQYEFVAEIAQAFPTLPAEVLGWACAKMTSKARFIRLAERTPQWSVRVEESRRDLHSVIEAFAPYGVTARFAYSPSGSIQSTIQLRLEGFERNEAYLVPEV